LLCISQKQAFFNTA